MDEYLEPILQYGAIGAIAIALFMFARGLLLREQQRGDAAAAEVQRLNNMIQERVIPALMTATQAISASQAILQGIQYKRDIEAAAKSNREKTT